MVLSWPLSSTSRYKSKNDADEAVSVVSLISSSGGYINGRNSANLGLLIDKTSSIYLYVKLKALASWIFLSFTDFKLSLLNQQFAGTQLYSYSDTLFWFQQVFVLTHHFDVHSGETPNTNLIVYGMTLPRLEPTIYRNQRSTL